MNKHIEQYYQQQLEKDRVNIVYGAAKNMVQIAYLIALIRVKIDEILPPTLG